MEKAMKNSKSRKKQIVAVVSVLLLVALTDPQVKTLLYSLPYGGDQLQSYKISIAEAKLKVRLLPQSSRKHYQLGILLVEHAFNFGDKDSNLANAVNEFEKAIECDPTFGGSYFWLGDIYLQYVDKPSLAVPLFNKAIERGFEKKASHARLIHAYERIGNPLMAQKHWEQYKLSE